MRLNPEPDLEQVAEDLCQLLVVRAEEHQRSAGQILSMV
jgi:hypothetical protein